MLVFTFQKDCLGSRLKGELKEVRIEAGDNTSHEGKM